MCADDIQSLVQLGSQLARLSCFQWFSETAASRFGAMGADGTSSVWFSLTHTLLLSRFQWFFETAASRFGTMNAYDIQCLVQLGSHTLLASHVFRSFFETAASRFGAR